MNCPNCGAVVRGNMCEYCGTAFNRHEPLNVQIEMQCDMEQIFRVMQSYREANGHGRGKRMSLQDEIKA